MRVFVCDILIHMAVRFVVARKVLPFYRMFVLFEVAQINSLFNIIETAVCVFLCLDAKR